MFNKIGLNFIVLYVQQYIGYGYTGIPYCTLQLPIRYRTLSSPYEVFLETLNQEIQCRLKRTILPQYTYEYTPHHFATAYIFSCLGLHLSLVQRTIQPIYVTRGVSPPPLCGHVRK